MSVTRIAVPSERPGGLEARVSTHFGHCEVYTLVDVEDGLITHVESLANPPHEQGGCMEPVDRLVGHGVSVLVSGGMGLRPLSGFAQAGIRVYNGQGVVDVDEAVHALVAGRLPAFAQEAACGGEGGGR
ncbi:MAG: NifB/NifX family molybdenum-iron cluster-binding protein [Desulfovibrionaceae bacterium]